MSALAPTLQAFFTDYLTRQRQASPHTITAYRDAIRLLLAFTAKHTGTQPNQLDIADLDAPLLVAFLDHLEHERHNTARTVTSYRSVIECLFGFVGRHASVPSAVRGAA
jgi:site-specific recombinase XerC